jgi:uncharacterized protein YbgA (DUF1722 family)
MNSGGALVGPITLVAHRARAQGAEYVLEQRYLSPHPKALMLWSAL